MDPPGTLYFRANPPPPGGLNFSTLPVQHGVGKKDWKPLPLDGSIPVSNYPDYHAKHSPNHVFAVWEPPLSQQPDDPSVDRRGKITQLDYALSVHRCGRYLLSAGLLLAVSRNQARPIGVILDRCPFTTQLVQYAVLRTGHYFFAISPRLPPASIAQMLAIQGCTHLVAGKEMGEAIRKEHERLGEAGEMMVIASPDGRTIFPMGEGEDRLEEPEWLPELGERKPEDVCLILHSGGSTGLPKAIPWTHRYVTGLSRVWWYSGGDMCDQVGTIGAMPPFHMMGVFNGMMTTMTTGMTAGLFRPLEPVMPTPDAVMRNMKRTRANALLIVPVFLEGWARDPEAVAYLTSLNVVWYGGGAISQGGAGEALVKAGVNLRMVYGSTEQGMPSQLVWERSPSADKHCWDGLRWSAQVDLKLVPHDGENYEPVIVANEGSCPAFYNVPGEKAYATSDLVTRCPDHQDFWKIAGRVDDWIVLSTGEKTAPADMERTIAGHPLIARAVMFGRGRPLHGVLVEPAAGKGFDTKDEAKLVTFRDAVWPAVEQANSAAPEYSRIFKEMIVVASPDRPFLLTDKVGVKRGATLDLYETEVNALYDTSSMQGDDIAPPAKLTADSTARYIRQLVARLLSDASAELKDNQDIFLHGVDSLGAIRLRNSILTTLRMRKVDVSKLSQDFVYQHPSIMSLIALVLALVQGEKAVDPSSPAARLEAMEREISRRVERLPARKPDAALPRPKKHVVVLTGSTGGLGSQLLVQLLKRKDVGLVYALNRRSTAAPLPFRQATALVERCGLLVEDAKALVADRRLRLLAAELGDKMLGLAPETYEDIRRTATVLIPNAWRVDFNIPLSSFAPQLDSVSALAGLARLSPLRVPPRIVFPSSIASVAGWQEADLAVPEEPVKDLSVAVGSGYGESKAVAEKVLEQAHVGAVAVRIGQLSGSTRTGAWSVTDWLPMLLQAGQKIGALPDKDGSVAWIGIDSAATALLDVAFCRGATPSSVAHIVHPRPVLWHDLFSALGEALDLPLIPYNDWLARLGRRASIPNAERTNPAVKLLSFYRVIGAAVGEGRDAMGTPRFETKKTQALSSTLAKARPLGREDVKIWVNYWHKGPPQAASSLNHSRAPPPLLYKTSFSTYASLLLLFFVVVVEILMAPTRPHKDHF